MSKIFGNISTVFFSLQYDVVLLTQFDSFLSIEQSTQIKFVMITNNISFQVFDSLESQETLTELFGQNAVDEISAVDDRIWQRKTSRKIIEMDNDSITLDQGVYGRTFQDREGISSMMFISNHICMDLKNALS